MLKILGLDFYFGDDNGGVIVISGDFKKLFKTNFVESNKDIVTYMQQTFSNNKEVNIFYDDGLVFVETDHLPVIYDFFEFLESELKEKIPFEVIYDFSHFAMCWAMRNNKLAQSKFFKSNLNEIVK